MRHFTHRRHILHTGLQFVAASVFGLSMAQSPASATPDPRPEFATDQITDALDFYFGIREAQDDASILMQAPREVLHGEMIPFRVTAPHVEKMALLTDANREPLIMTLEQPSASQSVMIGHARLNRGGRLLCYALRNGRLGRAEHPVQITGIWRSLAQ